MGSEPEGRCKEAPWGSCEEGFNYGDKRGVMVSGLVWAMYVGLRASGFQGLGLEGLGCGLASKHVLHFLVRSVWFKVP